jgi:hypothetical protein
MAKPLETELTVIDKMTAEVKKVNENLSGFAKGIEKHFSALTKGFIAFAALGTVVATIKNAVNK